MVDCLEPRASGFTRFCSLERLSHTLRFEGVKGRTSEWRLEVEVAGLEGLVKVYGLAQPSLNYRLKASSALYKAQRLHSHQGSHKRMPALIASEHPEGPRLHHAGASESHQARIEHGCVIWSWPASVPHMPRSPGSHHERYPYSHRCAHHDGLS